MLSVALIPVTVRTLFTKKSKVGSDPTPPTPGGRGLKCLSAILDRPPSACAKAERTRHGNRGHRMPSSAKCYTLPENAHYLRSYHRQEEALSNQATTLALFICNMSLDLSQH